MKVPYFLLELGDTCIFQPQNIHTRNIEMQFGAHIVGAWSYPEHNEITLCLNGNDYHRNYNILKIDSSNMEIYKTVIDNYNRSPDV